MQFIPHAKSSQTVAPKAQHKTTLNTRIGKKQMRIDQVANTLARKPNTEQMVPVTSTSSAFKWKNQSLATTRVKRAFAFTDMSSNKLWLPFTPTSTRKSFSSDDQQEQENEQDQRRIECEKRLKSALLEGRSPTSASIEMDDDEISLELSCDQCDDPGNVHSKLFNIDFL